MIFFKYFALVTTCFIISGCPYKETYKYQGQPIVQKEIEVLPQTVYFKKWKNEANCTIGFKIINGTDNVKRFNFQRSYLLTLTDTIQIQNVVFELGKLENTKEDIMVPPNSDTLVGLYFHGNADQFKGDINLIFSSSGIEDMVIKYKKVR